MFEAIASTPTDRVHVTGASACPGDRSSSRGPDPRVQTRRRVDQVAVAPTAAALPELRPHMGLPLVSVSATPQSPCARLSRDSGVGRCPGSSNEPEEGSCSSRSSIVPGRRRSPAIASRAQRRQHPGRIYSLRASTPTSLVSPALNGQGSIPSTGVQKNRVVAGWQQTALRRDLPLLSREQDLDPVTEPRAMNLRTVHAICRASKSGRQDMNLRRPAPSRTVAAPFGALSRRLGGADLS
jgi:hypothetical protein